MAPALSLLGHCSAIVITALFFPTVFYWLTTVLTAIAGVWISNLAISGMYGAHCLREGTSTDWHAKLEELQNADPTANDVLHIVLLPNYKENERMLKDTLENLGRSPMARGRTRVVLAMEQREGQAAREKAERLIAATSHLFADIFATFHPENVPGEVPGKSSNTQWAYREALRQYGPILLGCDLSRVFLTVGDADTHWHPQYLSAMTLQGLQMSTEQRSWRIWQPPILLMRNIFTVPAATRASAHATLIFELASLANQKVLPAFAYSAYSMTLALASHPEVDGWDVDVIAEDHHMFCKCFFAALWEQAHQAYGATNNGVKTIKEDAHSSIVPLLKVDPIFLPAVSYLVETDGYISSCIARFHQARRHMQGIVELGYVLLQYTRLTGFTGLAGLPLKTHLSAWTIAFKMHTLHVTTTSQCFAIIVASLTTFIPSAIYFISTGGVGHVLHSQATAILAELWNFFTSLDAAQQSFAAAVGNISGIMALFTMTVYVVLVDLIEGRYYEVMGHPTHEIPPVDEGDESIEGPINDNNHEANGKSPQNKDGKPSFVLGPRGFVYKAMLLAQIISDTTTVGYPAITVYALIPAICAACSLLRRGTDFEYIVAEKPEDQ